MSAKLSSAPPASAGPGIAGARAAPAAGAAAAAANVTADGVGAAGPGAGSASDARFSSAMAEAAKAHDQAALAHCLDGRQPQAAGAARGDEEIDTAGDRNHSNEPNGTSLGADQRSRVLTAADVARAASATLSAAAQGNSANALPRVEVNAAKPKPVMPGLPANTRGDMPRPSSGEARAAGHDDASAVTADPVALAMLLAASGMQLHSGTGASSTVDAPDSMTAKAADGSKPAMAAIGAANAPPVIASAQQVPSAPPPARAAAPATADAGSSAFSAAAALPAALAASPAKTADFESSVGQPSSMMGSAGLPDLVRSFAASSTQAAPAEATISVPVASGGWPHAVAAQVHWFVNNDVQSATLRLSPEHLGPVEVHIDVRHSQVNVNFTAAHAETRAALEQTVPRLREIFASGGLTLGQANVQQDPRPGSQAGAAPVRSAFSHAQTVEPVAVAAAHALGLVDEYV
jgi:flagellar hook-length control protein FliK